MKRGLVLAALAAAAAGAGSQPSPSAAALQAEKITDSLYVLRGGGGRVQLGGVSTPTAGNTIAFITASGVVLVDSKLPGWGKAITDKLKEITDKPVRMIINTHTHFDHVGGNADFPAGVEIVTHEETARLMKEMRPVAGGPPQPNPFKESNGRGLPTRTFKDRLTLGSGDERIELYWFGRGHTGGDAWVAFPAQRVLHTGDMFGHKAVPPLDVNNGASGVEYPRTLAKAIAALKDIDIVVTGHYPTSLTMADLKTYANFTGELVESIQGAKRAGGTIDGFVKAWKLPDRLLKEGYVDVSHLRPMRADVEVIWNETR